MKRQEKRKLASDEFLQFESSVRTIVSWNLRKRNIGFLKEAIGTVI